MEEEASLQYINNVIAKLRAQLAEQEMTNAVNEDCIANLRSQLAEQEMANALSAKEIESLNLIIGEKNTNNSSLEGIIESQKQTIACKDVIIALETALRQFGGRSEETSDPATVVTPAEIEFSRSGAVIPVTEPMQNYEEDSSSAYIQKFMQCVEIEHTVKVQNLVEKLDAARMLLKKMNDEKGRMRALYDIGMGVRIRNIVTDYTRVATDDTKLKLGVEQRLRKHGNECAHGPAPLADAEVILHCLKNLQLGWPMRQFVATYGVGPSVVMKHSKFTKFIGLLKFHGHLNMWRFDMTDFEAAASMDFNEHRERIMDLVSCI
ncbi:hypothetical protein OCU04_006442 [Sclerotinia nivalis]|uniref:Uncharacterized protein n=1 Tax=Sclerotinia nivalis TaxID=352851 RepID=A0A9X0DM86_9HELO|nr:hypothetical protein OCU04_006442 [Sclerotinia nivalis]